MIAVLITDGTSSKCVRNTIKIHEENTIEMKGKIEEGRNIQGKEVIGRKKIGYCEVSLNDGFVSKAGTFN